MNYFLLCFLTKTSRDLCLKDLGLLPCDGAETVISQSLLEVVLLGERAPEPCVQHMDSCT